MIRIGTLCSGIEAPIMAVKNFNLPHDQTFSCEINPKCQEVLASLYPSVPMFKDIYDVTGEHGGVDVLIAGLPCQSFSQIGQHGGVDDSRGNLYLEFCRVLDLLKPEWFIIENVRNLMTHQDGESFAIIKESLEACGYSIDHKMMDSSKYGIPQARKRVYIVGHRGSDINYEWPDECPLRYTLNNVMGGVCTRDHSYTLRVGGRGSGINNRHNWDSYMVDGEVVVLNEEQICLLQGFPVNFYNEVDVSKTAKFAQMGNAMTVDVVGAVMANLEFNGIRWGDMKHKRK